MTNKARDVLEEFASYYSEADVERLARLLEEIAKETAREILQIMTGEFMPFDKIIETISEKYGVEQKE